jgi:hypothetical protein
MKKISILFFTLCIANVLIAQHNNKVILITLDGFRWQELFGGADSVLINNKDITTDITEMKDSFWRETPIERRKALMPFMWTVVKEQGVLLGNRFYNNKMNLTNGMHFSYPGYNEILTGSADDEHINSNQKTNNPNISVLEIANQMPVYKGKVLVFGSWDVFPFILNEKRSALPINAGYRHSLSLHPTDKELYLNKIQDQTSGRWPEVRFDVFTHNYALEAIKTQKPVIVFISYGETDDYAHDGSYDQYLKSAHRTDGYIGELWNYIQSDPFYKNQTTLLITTDHGRGDGLIDNHSWRSHGKEIANSDQTWVIAIGNTIKANGEKTDSVQHYTSQIAATLAKIMDIPFDKIKADNNMNNLLEEGK